MVLVIQHRVIGTAYYILHNIHTHDTILYVVFYRVYSVTLSVKPALGKYIVTVSVNVLYVGVSVFWRFVVLINLL